MLIHKNTLIPAFVLLSMGLCSQVVKANFTFQCPTSDEVAQTPISFGGEFNIGGMFYKVSKLQGASIGDFKGAHTTARTTNTGGALVACVYTQGELLAETTADQCNFNGASSCEGASCGTITCTGGGFGKNKPS